MTPLLLIGLGNPGKQYAANRHNAGFMAIDRLREDYKATAEQKKFGGLVSEATIDGRKTLLFKPQSYMNLSGEPAVQLVQFFKIPLANITVFHDELALPLGKVRVKMGGGHAGHNGLKSLDAHLGQDYKRVRIGIAHPGDRDQVSNHVLSDFSKTEMKEMDALLEKISTHLTLLLQGDDAGFMNRLSPPPAKERKTEKKE